MVRTLFTPRTTHDYLLALSAMAIAGVVAFGMMSPLTRGTISLMKRFGYRKLSSAALGVVLALVFSVTGWSGLWVMTVAAGIGLIPVLFGSRRMNCLGVILLPMACNMSGVGPTVAGWLGLL
jgi:putative membrane protein